MSVMDDEGFPLYHGYEPAPTGDSTYAAASFTATLAILAFTSWMAKAPIKTGSLVAAVALALLNAGMCFYIHGFMVRIIQSALGAIGTTAVAFWLSVRFKAGQVIAAITAPRERCVAGIDESVEEHFCAAWHGWPQIMAYYEVVCLKQRWEIARNRKLAAVAAYNHHKANHDVLHPTDDNYAASTATLHTLLAAVNHEEVVLIHQKDRYTTVKEVYKNACRKDVFEPNTHSSFFARVNDAGQQHFNKSVNSKYGDLTLATIKDFVRRIKEGEVEELDQPAARPAAALEDEGEVVPAISGGGAPNRPGRPGRAGSVPRQ